VTNDDDAFSSGVCFKEFLNLREVVGPDNFFVKKFFHGAGVLQKFETACVKRKLILPISYVADGHATRVEHYIRLMHRRWRANKVGVK